MKPPADGPSLARRSFLKLTLALGAAAGALTRAGRGRAGGLPDAPTSPTEAYARWAAPPAKSGTIPYRLFGDTQERISLVGLGGAHIGFQANANESIRIVRAALDGGINFLDNCWDYNGGQSEIRMGKALLDGYRQKAFLMTKIDGHDRKTAAAQIDESLRRLQTDHVDLLQLHEVIRLSDPRVVFGPNGAIEALVAAKQAGKTRYLGFTGHKSPQIHIAMLNAAAAHNFRFDAVQMPLNLLDAHFDSFQALVLPLLVKDRIAALGMKPLAAGRLVQGGGLAAADCLHYAMNLPVATVITGCDSMAVLDQALAAGRDFQTLSPAQIAGLLAQSAPLAVGGKNELYKTTEHFDGTNQHPQWLGERG